MVHCNECISNGKYNYNNYNIIFYKNSNSQCLQDYQTKKQVIYIQGFVSKFAEILLDMIVEKCFKRPQYF